MVLQGTLTKNGMSDTNGVTSFYVLHKLEQINAQISEFLCLVFNQSNINCFGDNISFFSEYVKN